MLNAMTRQGLRITDQRRTIAKIFAKHDGYLSPKDVYEQLRKVYPGVSFDTIYRNLRLLSDVGLLARFYFMDGGQKFKACKLDHHHHPLICVNCEKTVAFDYCPMDHLGDLPGHYKIVNHRFEIYGICEACQQHGNYV
ncbi:transcriptional repressor [Paenibacillus rhizosphaerae]|uniref:Transcriptional repressor n=1 Tax=Paenibacillus rhizosphaerae TaxID=297318 RepID=A0A1R1ECC9_9BACL|nr:Fur family transcriptional regulator [Paenibacillus rhizosphaerae]OMF49483.1 transcriptional repressor [Paenibacillus rhizosphaerae]